MAARRKVSEKVLDAAWSEYANFMDDADVRTLFRVGGGDWSLLPKTTLWLVELCQLNASHIREDCCRQIDSRSRWGTTPEPKSSSGLAPDWNGARNLRIV